MSVKKKHNLHGGELPFEDATGAADGLVSVVSGNDGAAASVLSEEDKADIFRDLLSEEQDARSYALNILKGSVSPGEVIQFLDKLRPGDWQGKAACCALLEYFRDDASILKLKDLMLDFNPQVRHEAEKALKKLGHKNPVSEDEVAELVLCLTYSSWWVREQAIKSLEALGDPRAIGPISNLLKDEEDIVRRAAEEALKKLKQ